MKPLVSVIICTHNPKQIFMRRVIDALKTQSLSLEKWELLIVDNASSNSFSSEVNLSWHSNARCIREEKLGLVNARTKGIEESQAEVIVFVDDDNILEPNYLELALAISEQHPEIGVWGGQTLPGFEEEPPAWTKHYWTRVGIREFKSDQYLYSKQPAITPIGAGMCVRRSVAKSYADLVSKDSRRSQLLGRKGNMLLGCEDLDLAWTAGDLGLGLGLFTSLRLLHLIPKHRLDENYLLKAVQGSDYSEVILRFLRNGKLTWKQYLRFYFPWLMPPKLWFTDTQTKRFYRTGAKGRYLALKDILQNNVSFNVDNLRS